MGSREMAAKRCPLCNQKIGFMTRFYNDENYGLVHADCLENKLEEKGGAK
jgi:hypothetical protein